MTVMMIDALRAPWALAALLIVGVAALEAERWWTRARRRRATSPGALAYLLDALALGAALGFLMGGLLLAASAAGAGLAQLGLVALPGSQLEIAGTLAVCAALAAGGLFVGLARLHARDRSGKPGQAKPDVSALAAVSAIGDASALEPVAQPPDDAPADESGMEFFMNVSTMRQRPRAAPVVHPESFLSLREPAAPPAKRRGRLGPALLTLAVLVALAGGAFWYRQPLAGLVAGAVSAEGGVVPSALVGSSAARPKVVAPTVPQVTRRVKSDSLNLRAGPGPSRAVLAVLARGDAVALLGGREVVQNVEWVQVRAGEREGWVSAKLLE